MTRPSTRTFEQRLADGVSSVPRATSSNSNGAATSRPGRTFRRSSSTRPTRCVSCTASSSVPARTSWSPSPTTRIARSCATSGATATSKQLNRQAVRIANEIAAEGGALVAGNICNTWCYDPADPEASGEVVREQYREQLGWAKEEGVDFVISETNDYLGEALIGLEVCHELGLPGHGDLRERAAATPPTTGPTTSRRAASSPTTARPSSG